MTAVTPFPAEFVTFAHSLSPALLLTIFRRFVSEVEWSLQVLSPITSCLKSCSLSLSRFPRKSPDRLHPLLLVGITQQAWNPIALSHCVKEDSLSESLRWMSVRIQSQDVAALRSCRSSSTILWNTTKASFRVALVGLSLHYKSWTF